MCHEFGRRAWDRETEERDRNEAETPAFLNEDGGDVDVLTDGGE